MRVAAERWSPGLTLLITITAVALLGGGCRPSPPGASTGEGTGGSEEPEVSRPLPCERLLEGEDAQRVRRLELRLENLVRAGRLDDALVEARAISEIRKTIQGQDHWETVDALWEVTTLEDILKEPVSTRTEYRTLRELVRKTGELEESARYAEATPSLERLLAYRRRVLGDRHPDTGKAFGMLGRNLDLRGRHARARPRLETALWLLSEILGDNHPATALVCSDLARNRSSQGRHAEAELLYEESLVLLERLVGRNHLHLARIYGNRARNLVDHDLPFKALGHFQTSLRILQKGRGKEHEDTAAAHIELAQHLIRIGDPAWAQQHLDGALKIRRQQLGEAHPTAILTRRVEAALLDLAGEYAEAQAPYEQCLRVVQDTCGEVHPRTAACHVQLGVNLYRQGKTDEALENLMRAMDVYQKTWSWVSHLGFERTVISSRESPTSLVAALLAREKRYVEAWECWEGGLARGLLSELLSHDAGDLDTEDRLRQEEIQSELERLESLLVATLGEQSGSAGESAALEELRQRRLELQAELSAFQEHLSEKYPPREKPIWELSDIQAELAPDEALIGWLDLEGGAKHARPEGEHWAIVVRRTGRPEWVELPGSPQGVLQVLAPENTALVLAESLTDRKRAQSGCSIPPWQFSSLAAQRLAPVEDLLAERDGLPEVRRLIVLPSPALRDVPVGLLTGRYTVSYTPSASVLACLRKRARQTARSRSLSLLALGDPSFRTSGREERLEYTRGSSGETRLMRRLAERLHEERGAPVSTSSLPGSRQEVKAIEALFKAAGGETEVLLGSSASEQRLRKLCKAGELARYRYIVLSTHAVPDSERMFDSALLLARDGLPDPMEAIELGQYAVDGRLTAAEILRTWHLEADLVVLSACSSAAGRWVESEGYLGFAQALLLSGANTVILSLWKVDDRATALLMERLFKNLLGQRPGLSSGLPAAEALREAQAWLRDLEVEAEGEQQGHSSSEPGEDPDGPPGMHSEGTVRPYADPYYWAAFIPIGGSG